MWKIKEIIIFLLYFIAVILALGSIGVWLPLVISHYQEGHIDDNVIRETSGNLITYSAVIFITCFIDRIIQLFKKSDYSNNTIEFLILFVIVFGLAIFFVYKSIWYNKFNHIEDSIWHAVYLSGLSSCLWIYVKTRDRSFGNFNALGGEIL